MFLRRCHGGTGFEVYRTDFLQDSLKQTEGLSLQGLLIALAFGERAWLDNKTWLVYQQTNTAHLIAISGLHIGLAMGLGFFFARLLQILLPTRFISPWFPLCFGVLIALGYAYLAGFTNLPIYVRPFLKLYTISPYFLLYSIS